MQKNQILSLNKLLIHLLVSRGGKALTTFLFIALFNDDHTTMTWSYNGHTMMALTSLEIHFSKNLFHTRFIHFRHNVLGYRANSISTYFRFFKLNGAGLFFKNWLLNFGFRSRKRRRLNRKSNTSIEKVFF